MKEITNNQNKKMKENSVRRVVNGMKNNIFSDTKRLFEIWIINVKEINFNENILKEK